MFYLLLLLSIAYVQADDLSRESQFHVWREIQKQNNVVQIFSQRAPFSMLYPWEPPRHEFLVGSGFFITEDGYMLTNAHVVDQATMQIQIPALGKHRFDVELVGICHQIDVALLHVTDVALGQIRELLGDITPLPLGDSATVSRTDDVLAMGYPLGYEALKSTVGMMSGYEGGRLQIDAPINPGSSGGPVFNKDGEVIGLATSGRTDAQNVGFVVPINEIKLILDELYHNKLVVKPLWGCSFAYVTEETAPYLGNPQPGGCYMVSIEQHGLFHKAGIQVGDMIYAIDGYPVDIFGRMTLPYCEDTKTIFDYVAHIAPGQEVTITAYRHGEKLDATVVFEVPSKNPIRQVYPGYEEIDYEIFAGMVVMQLTVNHIETLKEKFPWLGYYSLPKHQEEPILIVTYILPGSLLHRSRTFTMGSLLLEVNGQAVSTLEQFRQAIKTIQGPYLVLRASEIITDDLLAVLPYDKVLKQEPMLAYQFHYALSATVQEILDQYAARLRNLAVDEIEPCRFDEACPEELI